MQKAIRIDVSGWRPSYIDTSGEVIFAVGDVHDCAHLLDALLNAFGKVNTCTAKPQRLVFLGDLINRRPQTIKTLQRWAEETPISGISTVDRLMGNREQLLLLATQRGASSKMAYDMILQCGGDRFLQELREAAGMPDTALGDKLLRGALGAEIPGRLRNELKGVGRRRESGFRSCRTRSRRGPERLSLITCLYASERWSSLGLD